MELCHIYDLNLCVQQNVFFLLKGESIHFVYMDTNQYMWWKILFRDLKIVLGNWYLGTRTSCKVYVPETQISRLHFVTIFHKLQCRLIWVTDLAFSTVFCAVCGVFLELSVNNTVQDIQEVCACEYLVVYWPGLALIIWYLYLWILLWFNGAVC